MLRLARRTVGVIVASSITAACTTPNASSDTPQAKTATAATASTASALPSTAASSSVAPVSDAGATAVEDTATPANAINTASWATLATIKKTITVKYPADVFVKTKLAGESVLLQSNLKRGLLGEGNGDKVHRYQIAVDWMTGTPFEAVRKSFKAYPFPQMFPKGTEDSYAAQEGEGFRVTVSGHAGYRVHTGVEGYNEDTVLLESGAKKTLRFRCQYVGSVMGPEIDDEKQVAICDAVLDSIVAAPAP